MWKFTSLALASLSLASCSQGEGQPVEHPVSTSEKLDLTEPERSPGGKEITSLGGLLGEYSVNRVGGRQLQDSAEIAVSVDGALLSFEPVCAGFVWEIEFPDDAIRLSRHEAPADEISAGDAAVPSKPKCAIGLPPEWRELANLFDNAPYVERTVEQNVRVFGEGRSVLLIPQQR